MDKPKDQNAKKIQGISSGYSESAVKGLNSLKAAGRLKSGKETLESRMPSRSENKQEIGSHEKIKIPTSKFFNRN